MCYRIITSRRKDTAIISTMAISYLTGRKNKLLMKRINKMIRENKKLRKEFFKATYQNKGNKNYYPMLYMTKKGYELLTADFNTERDLCAKEKINTAFKSMEFEIQVVPYKETRKREYKEKRRQEIIGGCTYIDPELVYILGHEGLLLGDEDEYNFNGMVLCGDGETWIPKYFCDDDDDYYCEDGDFDYE